MLLLATYIFCDALFILNHRFTSSIKRKPYVINNDKQNICYALLPARLEQVGYLSTVLPGLNFMKTYKHP
jgi:hypothetical protein